MRGREHYTHLGNKSRQQTTNTTPEQLDRKTFRPHSISEEKISQDQQRVSANGESHWLIYRYCPSTPDVFKNHQERPQPAWHPP